MNQNENDVVPGPDYISTGVPGLDEMMAGGYTRNTVALLVGESGTGRSTFAMQFLYEGLKSGESGLYIALAHSSVRLKRKFLSMYPQTEGFLDEKIHFINLEPQKFASSSYFLVNGLPELIRTLGVSRVVIDALTIYEDMLISTGVSFMSLYRLFWSLKSEECNSLVIVGADPHNPLRSRHGLSEEFADTSMFLFREFPNNNYLEPYRTLFVVMKSRYSGHSSVGRIVEYTDEGLITLKSPPKKSRKTEPEPAPETVSE